MLNKPQPQQALNKCVRKELPEAGVYDILQSLCEESKQPVRLRYANIAAEFYRLTDEYTQRENVLFASLLAKVDHLLKKNRPSGDGKASPKYSRFTKEVHRLRYRISHIDDFTDETLEKMVGYDLRSLCRYAEMLTKQPMPDLLRLSLPMNESPDFDVKLKTGYIRLVVDRVEGDTLYAANASQDMDEVRVSLMFNADNVTRDYRYLKEYLTEGAQINVVNYTRDNSGRLQPEFLIYEPDYLVDITSVASCFEDWGVTEYTPLIKNRLGADEMTIHILLGNFAGQVLDETVHGTGTVDYGTSIRRFFREYVTSILACKDFKGQEFHTMAIEQVENIDTSIDNLSSLPQYKKEKLMLEPSFVCEMLGIQGRMDMLQSDYSILVEQKSGKSKYTPGYTERIIPQEKHLAQVLLYQAILHYSYGMANGAINSFLLYSKYKNPLIRISNSPILISAIEMRNRIAALDISLAKNGFDMLLKLRPDDFLKNPSKASYFDRYIRPGIEDVLNSIQKADEVAQKYALKMLQFVQIEHVTSKIGFNSIKPTLGFSGTWSLPASERRAAGELLEGLKVKEFIKDEHTGIITHVVLLREGDGDDMPNFRKGDIVAMYNYATGEDPDIRRSVLVRSELVSLTDSEVKLKLRSPQTDERIFRVHDKIRFAISRDFYESSNRSQYKGIISLLQADESRRELILCQRKPKVNEKADLRGEYGGFNTLVRSAMRAQDLFLVIGPPGTGKTSYALLNIAKEELKRASSRLLLAAYTNRAVDEICSKLDAEGIDFIRIGSHLSSAEQWHKYLLNERIAGIDRLDEIITFMSSQRVIVGTLHALNGALGMLTRYHFTTAILDEASQVLEPQILPLLTSRDEYGGNLVDRFVMIGDHKQLPAIAVQDENLSEVDDAELNKIGLYNCRNSFFHRMLINAYNAESQQYDPNIVYMLSRQGRMHRDVAKFASQMFYDGKLEAVPLEHQTEEIPQCEEVTQIDALLNRSRMVMIDVKPTEEDQLKIDNANVAEAEAVAEVFSSILRREGEKFSNESTVGIIVPYRSQISAIRREIERRCGECYADVVIDTVERFQGSQREYIIYSTTVKRYSQLKFLSASRFVENDIIIDRKLNVALTRTRSHTIIVTNRALISRDPIYRELCKACTL